MLKFLLNKYRLQIGIFLVLAVLVGGGVLALINSRSELPEIEKVEEVSPDSLGESTMSASPSEPQEKIKVDIAGAVVHPGVCEILKDGRVEEALKAAGGLSDEADRDWISKNLNLAAKLSDGDKLYIPKVGEATQPSAGIVSGVGATNNQLESVSDTPLAGGGCSRVNINTASVATLDECLSGIGPAYAQRIIEYREAHGGFKSIEEIQEISGIGPKTFEKIKDQITVD